MDRELRVFVAGIGAARLAPDLLAKAIGIDELVSSNPRGIEPLEQAQIGELLDGVGQRVDADSELADGVGLLVKLAFNLPRMQHQGGGEPANAAPDDNGLHASTHSTIASYGIMMQPHARAQWLCGLAVTLLERLAKFPKRDAVSD